LGFESTAGRWAFGREERRAQAEDEVDGIPGVQSALLVEAVSVSGDSHAHFSQQGFSP
jgi:hypothetical protein